MQQHATAVANARPRLLTVLAGLKRAPKADLPGQFGGIHGPWPMSCHECAAIWNGEVMLLFVKWNSQTAHLTVERISYPGDRRIFAASDT